MGDLCVDTYGDAGSSDVNLLMCPVARISLRSLPGAGGIPIACPVAWAGTRDRARSHCANERGRSLQRTPLRHVTAGLDVLLLQMLEQSVSEARLRSAQARLCWPRSSARVFQLHASRLSGTGYMITSLLNEDVNFLHACKKL